MAALQLEVAALQEGTGTRREIGEQIAELSAVAHAVALGERQQHAPAVVSRV